MALALIVAAGSGQRLGSQLPKAFVALAGRPMLQWSVDVLLAVDAVERVVVALPDGCAAPAGTVGVRGGATRSQSVRLALAAAGAGDPVLVHDAARPLLTPELAERVLAALEQEGVDGAIAAAPMADTVKRAGADLRVLETLERSQLWAVQTPQAFRRAALERALDVGDDVLAAATDDSWLVERQGGRVVLVQSSHDNLKVTTAADLAVAEALLARRDVAGTGAD
jgi:2-C-methyl-D-erythritol 4-phosphate cytidylyltransferase